ncbi:VIT family-domain-containing protein [Pisolithus microcarpus]|nr:VIT family-domain-containing protein [Pisolithus microcarpus]
MPSETNSELAVSISVNRDSNNPPRPPVWSLESAGPGVPLQAKCDRHGRQGGICCKDVKNDDERTLVDPDIIRDVLVVLGGIAELIAGAISMGIEITTDSLRRHISARVQRSCDGEMEREVYAILGPLGVDEHTSQAVTKRTEGPADEERPQLRWKNDVGLTAFLLKFGEGLKEVPTRRLYLSAITIGLGYLVGGIIPLIPYFFISRAHIALLYSCILTGVVLLVFGAIKSRVTGAGNDVAGYIWGAVSTLMVGGAAAAAAYGMVALFERDS